jgi:hypothetical protein
LGKEMKKIVNIIFSIGIFLIFSSCHSIVKPKLDTIQVNEKAAVEKIIEAKNETVTIVENIQEIETIIENSNIPIETKKEIKTRIDNITIAANTVEIKIEDAIVDIEKNEQVLKSIEKDIKSYDFKKWIIIAIAIVVVIGFIIFKLIF